MGVARKKYLIPRLTKRAPFLASEMTLFNRKIVARCSRISIVQTITTNNQSDLLSFCNQRAIIADKSTICNFAGGWNLMRRNKNDGIRTYNTMKIALRYVPKFIVRATFSK